MKKTFVIICMALMAASCKQDDTSSDEWPTFNRDASNNKFSQLTSIDTTNVSSLKEVWKIEDTADLAGLYMNPIMFNNRLISLMPSAQLVALHPATGKKLWSFKPDSSSIPNWSKGITGLPARNGEPDRVFLIFGGHLYAINAETGKVMEGFGENGRVDFYQGLEVPDSMRNLVQVSSNAPGVVYNDLFIVGCKVPDELPSTSGDIRAFNVNSGKLEWVFHTIPKPGEYGADTWNPDARSRNGGANCWAGMALDEKRGIVYVPTASPSFDFYGADRPGQNLFANCLLALDAKTGKRIWHFQTTHHDLWDRDNGSPPNLVTVEKDGKKVDAVALVTKMGYLFVFNRETGESVFGINEVPVDTVSTMPGEKPWPTQPIPVNPPFARQGYKEEYFGRSADWIKKEIKSNRYKTGIYEPPSMSGSIILPTAHGGANWGGASVNPQTNMLFVNSTDIPWILKMTDLKKIRAENQLNGQTLYMNYCKSCHGVDMKGGLGPDLSVRSRNFSNERIASIVRKGAPPMPAFSYLSEQQIAAIVAYVKDTTVQPQFEVAGVPQNNEPFGFNGYNFYLDSAGDPAIKPPFGTMSAIDLNTGNIAWQVPLGDYEKFRKQGMANTGSFNRGGGIATAGGLIFIGATEDGMFRAFDQRTGKLLWQHELPGMASSIPSTYAVEGKQYVVIAVTGNDRFKGGYVAFSLELGRPPQTSFSAYFLIF